MKTSTLIDVDPYSRMMKFAEKMNPSLKGRNTFNFIIKQYHLSIRGIFVIIISSEDELSRELTKKPKSISEQTYTQHIFCQHS